MQRLLVGLVVFLTAAVGVLGLTVYSLHSEVSTASRRSASATPRDSVEVGVQPARVEKLEDRLSSALREIDRLQSESKRLAREVAARRARAAAKKSSGDAGQEPEKFETYGRPKDMDGEFVITDQDEEFFLALQKRVERRRRIEGMTRNVMRRVESLEKNGDIQPLTDENRAKVQTILGRFVVEGDDLVTRYVRAPDEATKALDNDARRAEMAKLREEIVQQAQLDLDTLLGPDDAAKIGERSLRAYGSWRRSSRPSVRRRNR